MAAFKISTVCSSSAFFRFSSRISRAAAVVVPSTWPASTSACRTHFRIVSALIPNRAPIVFHRFILRGVVASMILHQTDRLGPRLRVVLLRHGSHLPNQEGVHQTRDDSVLSFSTSVEDLWPVTS